MRFSKILLLAYTVCMLASCSTVIGLPMHSVMGEASGGKSSAKLMVSWDESLESQSYSTSQLGTTWIYPLGHVVPKMAIDSLSEFFYSVDSSKAGEIHNYNFSVSIKLLNFSAKVPSTIFSPTETVIELEYSLLNISTGENISFNCSANQEVVTPRDQFIFDNLNKEVKELFAYASGVVVTAPKYEYLAARDGMMAISKCTYELAQKIDSAISKSLITSQSMSPLWGWTSALRAPAHY